MAKTAAQYPVTYKFGYSKDYFNYAVFHSGEDRGCPTGTALVVNKTKLGETGDTGWSTGAHLHITRRRGGKAINPKGSGFRLRNIIRAPRVVYIGQDDKNGKYIVAQNWQGDKFYYCHLSKIICKVGQQIK